MKTLNKTLPRAIVFFLIFSVICGFLYTGAVTGAAQLLFPTKANGSIIEVNGRQYSTLLGQSYTDDGHLWGRITNLDVTTYKDEEGNALAYAGPSNLSPTSDAYQALVKERVEKLRAADPSLVNEPIPVDLVTCSASGLDPEISVAAAKCQVGRIAKATGKSEEEVQAILDKCTEGKLLGIFGEKTVNVARVNLMLDGIL